jgi:hypothetical protein
MRAYEQAERLALLFVVDATGSMGPHIQAVKAQITAIVAEMRKTNPAMRLHLGFLGYRDHTTNGGVAEPRRFEELAFTDDVAAFKVRPHDFASPSADTLVSAGGDATVIPMRQHPHDAPSLTPPSPQAFVSAVEARDGGDAPEDVHGALHRALQMEWDVGGSMTRVLVHIADAPCHGTKYHTLSGDSHPGGDPHGLKSAELLRGLRQLGVSYTFGRINESTDRMVRLFDEEAGGGYISECDVADCRAITKVVTATLRASISHTHDALLGGFRIGGGRAA